MVAEAKSARDETLAIKNDTNTLKETTESLKSETLTLRNQAESFKTSVKRLLPQLVAPPKHLLHKFKRRQQHKLII